LLLVDRAGELVDRLRAAEEDAVDERRRRAGDAHRLADGHVRVAIGLDSLGAAAVRGTRLGVGAETLAVAIRVDQ